MKTNIMVLIVVAALFPMGGALAQTDSARELKRLQDERDKGMAAAVEPVKRRYLSALEPLLRRATQMNDLECD